MKIAVYSRNHSDEDVLFIRKVFDYLTINGDELLISDNFRDHFNNVPLFASYQDLKNYSRPDFLFSLGGDGTFLDSANLVGDLNIPIVGINTGRIGFLTGINKNDFEKSFRMLENKEYVLEERALLHLECQDHVQLTTHFALNDITLHSSDLSYVNTIKVWVNNEFVNTYWADGLIIATPTGSTAYSLSCGGPIIMPMVNANVIIPIASHSLSVRPIIVSEDDEITVTFESRSENFSLTLDSIRAVVTNPARLTISKEKFTIKTVRFLSAGFFSVIREKLMWGLDKRNITEI
jgi:NAD+ kinase